MQEFINSTINTKVYNQMSDEHQIIKIQDKECLIENIGTIVSGDTNSCLLTFEINRFQDGVDLSRKKVECIYRNRNGEYPPDEMVNVKYNDEIIRFFLATALSCHLCRRNYYCINQILRRKRIW